MRNKMIELNGAYTNAIYKRFKKLIVCKNDDFCHQLFAEGYKKSLRSIAKSTDLVSA